MIAGNRRLVVQVGEAEIENARLSVVVERIEWIDATANAMRCAPGIAMWQVYSGECDVLSTTVPPKRIDSDDEVRYVFPGPLRLTGTYDEQRQAAIETGQVAADGSSR